MPSLSSALSCVPRRGALAVCALLAACGGGQEDTAVSPTTMVATTARPLAESFPTGLVVAAPARLTARSGPTGVVDPTEVVLAGASGASLAGLLEFAPLFAAGADAGCFGPAMLYANHEDGSGAESGLLPRGTLGLWTDTDTTTGQPCAVAQLSARTTGLEQTTRQALLLVAALRAMLHASGDALAMPAAGARTDLSQPFAAVLALLPALSDLRVQAATVALDAGGSTYTYRLTVHRGAGTSTRRSAEIVLQHRPGATATAHDGVLRVAGFDLGTDATTGCSDRMTSGRYQRARVTTVRYRRQGDQIDLGARSAQYCGAPADLADADHAAQVAAFTPAGELDPAAALPAVAHGWRSDFDRFGAQYDRATGTGQFLSVWQTRPGDGHARALAAHSQLDPAVDQHTVAVHFAHTTPLASTDGRLLGLVCNPAGPGAAQSPTRWFQSQTATRMGTSAPFVATRSRLAHAPTNACTSTTTVFDANADGTLSAGEGLGAGHALDAPTAPATTVQDELLSRGYRPPGYF
jgi:hypothetical protein